jgi:hypothetical protein
MNGFGNWTQFAQALLLTRVKFVCLFYVCRPTIVLRMKPSEIRNLI